MLKNMYIYKIICIMYKLTFAYYIIPCISLNGYCIPGKTAKNIIMINLLIIMLESILFFSRCQGTVKIS